MLNAMLKYLVWLSPLVLISTPSVQGFWWRSTTTEAPPTPPMMKQIPLTYFRTYTYQPLPANPLPFPLMSSTDYLTNYAALANNPYFNPMMSLLGGGAGGIAVTGGNSNDLGYGPQASMGGSGAAGVRPSKSYATMDTIRSLKNGPQIVSPKSTSSSTTTTTTTTTTRKPTTTTTRRTTSTTSTTEPTTTSTSTSTTSTTESLKSLNEGASTSSGPVIKTDSMVNIETAYPAFNRKVYTNHFNINYNRPVYPYPEYSIYKPSNSQISASNEESNSATSSTQTPPSSPTTNVEFVPCMCPVNIQSGYPSGLPITGNPSNSIFLAQGRTNPDTEAGIEILASDAMVSTNDGDLITEEMPMTNFVEDLSMSNMDGGENGVTPSLSAS
ncbi:uncharacterized protein LOC142229804 [Haematobia irritans]|uniref:uncharacterized protein LOC142229804 n=1 Tax=Haematobia irritans TaxID=7368 RepID=UPI003F50426B